MLRIASLSRCPGTDRTSSSCLHPSEYLVPWPRAHTVPMQSSEGVRLMVKARPQLLLGLLCWMSAPGPSHAFMAALPSRTALRLLSQTSPGAGPGAAPVKEIKSMTELQELIESTRDKTVVFRYHAQWCRACKAFAPQWLETANIFSGRYEFVDVDVGGDREIIKKQSLKVLPHIQMYAPDGSQLENFSTSTKKLPTLLAKLEEHARRE